MTRVSVFTPSHRPHFLAEVYASLQAQTIADWEWVVLLNDCALSPSLATRLDRDVRVRLESVPNREGVGWAKARAVEFCTAPVLVELDHDDLLAPDCLRSILEAFDEHPQASLVYTNTVQVGQSTEPDLEQWSPAYGWEYREVSGRELFKPRRHEAYLECLALPPTPHNVSLIWYAPNHARAFTREAYDAAGGYNEELRFLDDQDLMCRLYQRGEFVAVERPLYLQRLHAGMTQRDIEINRAIQNVTWDLYEAHLQPNVLAWARRNDLAAIDIGCGNAKADGYVGVDRYPLPGVDVVAELPDLSAFEDSSVGVVRAVDALEHVADQRALMAEIHRVLAPGGMLLSLTPSTDGRGAFQDPTHVSFWNQNSFWYWTDEKYEAYSPQTAGQSAKFQVSRVRTYFPTDWHSENLISYVQANLIAIKDQGQPRNGGELSVTVTGRTPPWLGL